MPDIAEMKKIFDFTPESMNIMIVGIHGIGKSEWTKTHYESKGYKTIIVYTATAADAGDLVGLPRMVEVEIDGIKRTITDFAAPYWWPFSDTDKVCIIFDEINRAKLEILQAVHNMTLTRELAGKKLNDFTRILCTINPPQEDLDYDVSDLDPAFMDRFNIYDFKPTATEWMDYMVSVKGHKVVIGFISKNNVFLDPPDTKRKNEKYPSRRSWKRVSDILVAKPELLHEEKQVLFKTMLMGIVGAGAASKFITYIREAVRNISGGKIVTGWDADVERQVKEMNNQDLVHLNSEIAMYLEQENEVLFESSGKKSAEKYAYNVGKYLASVPPEIMATFFDHVTRSEQDGKKWGDNLLSHNQTLVNHFVNTLHGSDKKKDKEVERIIGNLDDNESDHIN